MEKILIRRQGTCQCSRLGTSERGLHGVIGSGEVTLTHQNSQ